MDLVEALHASQRTEADDDGFALICRRFPARMLSETELGENHMRVLEEALTVLEALHLSSAHEFDREIFGAQSAQAFDVLGGERPHEALHQVAWRRRPAYHCVAVWCIETPSPTMQCRLHRTYGRLQHRCCLLQ